MEDFPGKYMLFVALILYYLFSVLAYFDAKACCRTTVVYTCRCLVVSKLLASHLTGNEIRGIVLIMIKVVNIYLHNQ